jgi:hypothetical protein
METETSEWPNSRDSESKTARSVAVTGIVDHSQSYLNKPKFSPKLFVPTICSAIEESIEG